MKNDSKGDSLRNKAEEILSHNAKLEISIFDDFFELVNELQTYQIELELQNEELRRTGKELEEARQKYFDLYEFAPVGYFSLDENEIIKDVNIAGSVLLGVENKELINRAFIRHIHAGSRRKFYEHLKKVKTTYTPQTCEIELIKKDDITIYVHLETLPIQDDTGGFNGYRITVTNITELIKAENALRESEELFRLVFDQSPIGDILVDLDFHPLQVNNSLSSMLGYSKKELLSMKFPEYTHPDDLDTDLQQLRLLKDNKINYYEIEKRYIRKDGEIVWGHVYVTAVKNASDNLAYILVRVEDITEHKQMEKTLRDSEEKYRTLYETMTQGVIYQDSEGHIISVNPAAEQIIGINHYIKQGKTCNYHSKAIHEDGTDFPEETHPSNIALKTGKEVRNVVMGVFNAKKERYGWINVNATPLFKPGEKKPIQVYITFEDITETIKANKLLKKTMKDLKRSNRELEQFAYVASHDLQEPLRMVSSFTQLLEMKYKNKLDDEALEYINFAVDGAKRMKLLIQDLLTYSRVTSKAEEFEEVELENVLDDVLFDLGKKIEENQAIITREPLPKIHADYSQILQAFQNLIGNALKYRSQKTPKIHISVKKKDKQWLFSVEDNGIGIEPEYHENVFQIFRRLHSQEEYEGTGIGLAITKRIIERHKGRIWVESEQGKGTTFYFTIPTLKWVDTLKNGI